MTPQCSNDDDNVHQPTIRRKHRTATFVPDVFGLFRSYAKRRRRKASPCGRSSLIGILCIVVLIVATVGLRARINAFEHPHHVHEEKRNRKSSQEVSKWWRLNEENDVQPSDTIISLNELRDPRSSGNTNPWRQPRRRKEEEEREGFVSDNSTTSSNTTNTTTTAPTTTATNRTNTTLAPSTTTAPSSSAQQQRPQTSLPIRHVTPCYTNPAAHAYGSTDYQHLYPQEGWNPILLETEASRLILVSTVGAKDAARRARHNAAVQGLRLDIQNFSTNEGGCAASPTNGSTAESFRSDVETILMNISSTSSDGMTADQLAVWYSIATVYDLCRFFSFDTALAAYQYNRLHTTTGSGIDFATLFDRGMPWDNFTQIDAKVTVNPYAVELFHSRTKNTSSSNVTSNVTNKKDEVLFVTSASASCTVPSLSLYMPPGSVRQPGQMVAVNAFTVTAKLVLSPLQDNTTKSTILEQCPYDAVDNEYFHIRPQVIHYGALNDTECLVLQLSVTSPTAALLSSSLYGSTELAESLLDRLSQGLAYANTLVQVPEVEDVEDPNTDDDVVLPPVTQSPALQDKALESSDALTMWEVTLRGLGFCTLRYPNTPWAPLASGLLQTDFISYITTKDDPLDNEAPGVAIWTFLVLIVFAMFLGILLGVVVVRWCLKQDPLPPLKGYVQQQLELTLKKEKGGGGGVENHRDRISVL